MTTAYTPATGDVLGGCRLERLTARGGMGVVYEATHLALERRVAVKVISPHLAGDEVFRERFIREARLAASLHDPHVVDVYDAGEQDGVLYLVMRFIDGTDLRTVLRSEGTIEPGRALRIADHVARALDAAHVAGLIHRDVTPSNVLLSETTQGERASLTDFGLVKSIDTAGVTGTGPWLGTVAYVAPEALRGEAIDGRADVYALACVLYRMLTGEVPYERGSDAATIAAHLHDTPPRPSDAGLPAALDAVIARGLAKNPGDRPATAGDLVGAARAAVESPPIPDGAGRPGPDDGERPAPRPIGGSDARWAADDALTTRQAGVTRRLPGAAPERPADAPTRTQEPADAGGPSPSAADSADAPRAAKPARRRARAAAGGAVVALLAAGGGFALGAALSEEEPAPPRRAAIPRTPATVSLRPYSTSTYTAQVPRTWRLVDDNVDEGGFRRSRWRAPEPWHAQVEILHTEGSLADPDELAQTIRGRTAVLPTYTEVAFGPIELNGEDAVRWVYGTRGSAHMKWYANPCEATIAVHGTTRPSELLRWAPTMRAVAASVRPAC